MSIATHSITVDNVEIHSVRDFDSVAKSLENALPALDPAILDALVSGDLPAAEKRVGKAALFIFLKRDHGALLGAAGEPRKVFQYEIGNPLTAMKMTRHQRRAALYAPLRVTLFENDLEDALLNMIVPQVCSDNLAMTGSQKWRADWTRN